MKVTRQEKIPEKRMSEVTDRRFMLRYEDDGGVREPSGRFHRDDYFMIGVVFSGKHPLSIDFEDVELGEGDAVIVCPGQIHASHDNSDGEGFVLVLSPELISETELQLIREQHLGNLTIKLSKDDLYDIKCLFEILQRRKDKNSSAEQALVDAIKSFIINNIESSGSKYPGRYVKLVNGLQNLLDTNIQSVKSPTDFASMLNVSGVYLNESVKAVTGKSVSGFIADYIVMRAKRELCHTQLSAQQIAWDFGYEDYSYFSRLFSRHVGMSPKAFRDKYLE